jgi:homoserine kinase type II
MAVFTQVSIAEAAALLRRLGLGELSALRGIQGGIENTNYFATTDQGEYVLTLFERLGFAQLPFYLQLMKHLAGRGIPVPDPVAEPVADPAGDPKRNQGNLLHTVAGKPAAVVNKLRGASQLSPGPQHCAAMGDMLARMHLAGRDFALQQPNLRGLAWWNETVPVVLPYLQPDQAALLGSELAYQNHVAGSAACAGLRRGPVHADLFRDNVMFEGDTLTGLFDFYFAGVDSWLFDLAVCLNDWCIDLSQGTMDGVRLRSFVMAYQNVCPLNAAERQLLPAMARAAALRFWVSRLWDFHLPRDAALLTPHDPTHFERVLRERVRQPLILTSIEATPLRDGTASTAPTAPTAAPHFT